MYTPSATACPCSFKLPPCTRKGTHLIRRFEPFYPLQTVPEQYRPPLGRHESGCPPGRSCPSPPAKRCLCRAVPRAGTQDLCFSPFSHPYGDQGPRAAHKGAARVVLYPFPVRIGGRSPRVGPQRGCAPLFAHRVCALKTCALSQPRDYPKGQLGAIPPRFVPRPPAGICSGHPAKQAQ